MTRAARAGWVVSAALQLVFGLCTFGRFAPVADGQFYHTLATRLAAGLGYTVAWPDGVVTYAAHFPVGYPALLSLPYRLFGASTGWAWALAAALHLAATAALVQLSTRRAQGWVSFGYGLHPALFFYTPALMTEGVTGSLWALCLWAAWRAEARGSVAWRSLCGVLLGVAVLVRPQSLLLGAGLVLLGVVRGRTARGERDGQPVPHSAPRWLARAAWALLPLLIALSLCAPWTARNCARMQRCSLVAMNDGWNLLIGTQTVSGGWEPLQVPAACREVYDEAGKDVCFGDAAKAAWRAAPLAQLRKAPAKLRMVFDYFGAAPYTLHEAAPELVDERRKLQLAAFETFWQRLLWLFAPWSVLWAWCARRRGAEGRRGPRWGAVLVALGSSALAFTPHAVALSALGLCGLCARGWTQLRRPARWMQAACSGVLAATLTVHALVFGAGRYGLVLAVPCAWLAADALARGLSLWRLRRARAARVALAASVGTA